MKYQKVARLLFLLMFALTNYTLFGQDDFEEFQDQPSNSGFVDDLSFEDKLFHIRGIMIERDVESARAETHKKIDKALHGFLQTEFMEKFRELKVEAESLVATFKTEASQMAPQDVARVKKGYEKVAYQFNLQLDEIKRDFMDRKKLKLIRKNKEMYSNSLQYKLGQLKDSYSQDFEMVVADVTGSDMYSAIPLSAILGLIKLAADLTEYLIKSGFEARAVKEDHLNQFFIEPYRFKEWDEIIQLEGDVYLSTNSDERQMEGEVDDNWDSESPFDEEPASLKPKKRKKNN